MADNINVPEGILCTQTNEWVLEEDGYCTIGITDLGISQMGDVVFVELPEIGASFEKNEVFGTIESVKAASEIYMPVSGKILEVNVDLINSPEIINEDPYEQGWLIKIESTNLQEDTMGLLEYEDYLEEMA